MGRWAPAAGSVLALGLAFLAGVLVMGAAGLAAACKVTSIDCRPGSGNELSQTTGTMILPDGFTAEPVASGLEFPTAFDFLPDGPDPGCGEERPGESRRGRPSEPRRCST